MALIFPQGPFLIKRNEEEENIGCILHFRGEKIASFEKKSSNSIIKTLRPFVGISSIIDFIFPKAMDSTIHLDWDPINFRKICSPDEEATVQHRASQKWLQMFEIMFLEIIIFKVCSHFKLDSCNN